MIDRPRYRLNICRLFLIGHRAAVPKARPNHTDHLRVTPQIDTWTRVDQQTNDDAPRTSVTGAPNAQLKYSAEPSNPHRPCDITKRTGAPHGFLP